MIVRKAPGGSDREDQTVCGDCRPLKRRVLKFDGEPHVCPEDPNHRDGYTVEKDGDDADPKPYCKSCGTMLVPSEGASAA